MRIADCEQEAGKRWISKAAEVVASHQVTLLGDDLSSKQPFCALALPQGLHFILTYKPDSHATRSEWLAYWQANDGIAALARRHWYGRFTDVQLYRYLNVVRLRDGEDALSINWFEITVVNAKTGEQLSHNSFITNHRLHADNVADVAQAGRGRWKIENDNTNVLQTKGDHLAHNFGHGQHSLSAFLFSLNLLAFLFQYLRQNRLTCKGFCRFLELLSATTTTPNPQEALDGHFSMLAMPPSHRPKDNAASMPLHCDGDVVHDGACDDVGPVAMGWPKGQLSDRPTLFRDGHTVGHALLGVLSAPHLSVRGCLPARGRRSHRHQSRQEHPWSGSVLCQSVWQASARTGLFHVFLGEHSATALVPAPRRASRAQRRGESR